MTAMTLYGYFRSSAAFRVRIALNLKGLEHDLAFVHLRRHEQHSEAYRAVNPQELVPTLVHDGHTFGQSLAIIEYLDEIAPVPPLLPRDAAGRARVRQIAGIIACEIHPLGNLRVQEYLRDVMDRSEAEIVQWHRHWMALGLEAVERIVAQSPETGQFCHGATATLADIFLVPQLANARRVDLDLTPYPTLTRIEKTALGFAAFDDAQPKNQPDAE